MSRRSSSVPPRRARRRPSDTRPAGQRLQGTRRDGRAQLPECDSRRTRGGAGARRVVFLIGEDVEPGGVFNATPDLRRALSEAGDRHADLRARVHRRRVRCRRQGPASCRRDHVRRLPRARPRHARQPGLEVLVPLRRAGERPARRPQRRRRRAPLRRMHSQTPSGLVPGRAGTEARRCLERGRREGADEGRDPRRQPGDRLRAQAALRPEEDVPDGEDALVPIGKAAVLREGGDVTIAAAMAMVESALGGGAARGRRDRGRGIDLRTLRPLDERRSPPRLRRPSVSSSSKRARRRAATPPTCRDRSREAGPIRAQAASRMPDLPIPFSAPLEDWARPDVDQVVEAARQLTR